MGNDAPKCPCYQHPPVLTAVMRTFHYVVIHLDALLQNIPVNNLLVRDIASHVLS